jgi:L-rhamnose-H+ transport protein
MNPFVGVIFHWLGGLASGSFYVPYRGVKRWSWETYWLVGGIFSWIIAPWVGALVNTKDVIGVLKETPLSVLGWTYFFGALWGLGGLTFGLTMRYLGMSLGMAVALGYCTVFGTLIPPIYSGEFVGKLLTPTGGRFVLLGLLVCIFGIIITALAGKAKERGMSEEEKKATIKDFDFKKGLMIATFSGVMSACFSFGLKAGDKISVITKAHGTSDIWSGLPVLIVILLGGFTTNFIWCAILNMRNGTAYQYFTSTPGKNSPPSALINHGGEGAPIDSGAPFDGRKDPTPVPLFWNYFFSGLAGVTWYFQFFFYTMGETKMGDYKFSSWTLHMASIIIFSSIWGIALKEWKGASPRAKGLLYAGLAVLVLSTIVVGYGNYISGQGGGH